MTRWDEPEHICHQQAERKWFQMEGIKDKKDCRAKKVVSIWVKTNIV